MDPGMPNAMAPVRRVTETEPGDEAVALRSGIWVENLTFVGPDGCIIRLAAFAGARR
jgi:hypothetical protein